MNTSILDGRDEDEEGVSPQRVADYPAPIRGQESWVDQPNTTGKPDDKPCGTGLEARGPTIWTQTPRTVVFLKDTQRRHPDNV